MPNSVQALATSKAQVTPCFNAASAGTMAMKRLYAAQIPVAAKAGGAARTNPMIDEGDTDDMTPAQVMEMMSADETQHEVEPSPTPTQPESAGPTMLAHLLHPAPRPRRPTVPSYPSAELVLAAAKARGTTRARPASKGPGAVGPTGPPPPKISRGAALETGGNNHTVSSMILQGIDPAMASVLHRIHVQNNTVWETRAQPAVPPAYPKATSGPPQLQQRRPSEEPPAVSPTGPIQLVPMPEVQQIGYLNKQELFDLAIALTRRQEICIDTVEQNGANSMLHGTMETLQHGKCLVKIPIRAVQIHKVIDHPHQ